MISAYFEICKAKKLLDQAADSLEKEGLPYNREIDIGIMIEVPSAVVVADSLAEKVDFFSIGTNDLIQYALAIDRGNRHVADLYQPLDPAIIRMIKQVADVSKDKGIGVFMCGEMAATPHHIPLLLGMGMDELSMNPQSIPQIKRVIRSLNVKDVPIICPGGSEKENRQRGFRIVAGCIRRHACGSDVFLISAVGCRLLVV